MLSGRPAKAVSVSMMALAVLGAGVSVLAGLTGAGRADAPSAKEAARPVEGYPQRIGFERPSPPLPARSGALAATMVDNDFGRGRELAITAEGGIWELPQGINVLSEDGAHLLSGLPGRGWSSPMVARDLVTGEKRVFDDIGEAFDARERRRFRYVLDERLWAYWSPDATTILGPFEERPRRGHPHRLGLLDVDSGVVTVVPGDAPAGFRSATEAVTVLAGASGGLAVMTTSIVTGETRAVPLRLRGPWDADPRTPLRASVSPDGSTLMLIDSRETLRLFSLADGTELPSRHVEDWDGCRPSWLGDDPVVPTRSGRAGSMLVTAEGSHSLVAVHHRMQSRCLELTNAALLAGPGRSLLGTSTALWTWYWWQLLLTFSLGALLLGWLLSRRAVAAPRHDR